MYGDIYPRRRPATLADYHAAGRRAEVSRHSLTEHDAPTPDDPAWMRSGIPEAVAAGLIIEDDRRRDEAFDKLRRVVAAWRQAGSDER